MSAIEKIFAREIIDSRGVPTVEVEIHVENETLQLLLFLLELQLEHLKLMS